MNQEINKCIICLEEQNKYVPTTKLFHVPCDCHLYIHSTCFRQCNSSKCLVCKQEYPEEKMYEYNAQVNKHYRTSYSNLYQILICLIHLCSCIVGIFFIGSIITVLSYSIGYFFSCINQLIDNGYCKKNFFEGTHLYIGVFTMGIFLALRAESKDRQIERINRTRENTLNYT